MFHTGVLITPGNEGGGIGIASLFQSFMFVVGYMSPEVLSFLTLNHAYPGSSDYEILTPCLGLPYIPSRML
jgi:hypothetical protein